MGWDLEPLLEQRRLMFVDATLDAVPMEKAGSYDLSGLLVQIQYAIKETGAELLAMDSIGSLFDRFSDTVTIRREIFRISDTLKEMGVTALLTGERQEEYGQISRFGVEEFVSDTVIILRNVLREEKCRRTIQVLKMRGDTH